MCLKMAYPVCFNYPRIGVDFVARFLIHDNPILVASKIAKADSVGIRLGTTTSVKFKSSSAERASEWRINSLYVFIPEGIARIRKLDSFREFQVGKREITRARSQHCDGDDPTAHLMGLTEGVSDVRYFARLLDAIVMCR